jgi:hypothetical protein
MRITIVHELIHVMLYEMDIESGDGDHSRPKWGDGLEIPIILMVKCEFDNE